MNQKENLLQGLENYRQAVGIYERTASKKNNIERLVEVHGLLEVLIFRTRSVEDSSDIMYQAQDLQIRLMTLIKEKIA